MSTDFVHIAPWAVLSCLVSIGLLWLLGILGVYRLVWNRGKLVYTGVGI